MKNIVLALISLLFVASINAQIINPSVAKKVVPRDLNISSLSKNTLKMTSFIPSMHSFKFANTFEGVDASTRYGGLCGGMVYTVLDYYYARIPIPQQNYAPSNRYLLQSYIYKRQAKSAQESNWDKWAELGINPRGIRNSEFFGWGIQMTNPGDRMNELKNMIDSGKPAPLGLFHSDEVQRYGYRKGGDHQVLAIGYDFGRYKGDQGNFIEDFKIFVSDPNYPTRIMTLVADVEHKCFHYLEGDKDAWLTYFVNSKYEKMAPPTIVELDSKKTLYVNIGTGHDDLRGGNDNLSITVIYRDGSKQAFPNVNASATWVGDYNEVIPLSLNKTINNKSDIKEVLLECSFSGGIGGENWDMKSIKITTGAENNIILDQQGTIPRDGFLIIKRFTGSERFLTFTIN